MKKFRITVFIMLLTGLIVVPCWGKTAVPAEPLRKARQPLNEEGNSTFEIPVAGFDYQIPVTADTIAMSTPHEIEYTLQFASASIKKRRMPRRSMSFLGWFTKKAWNCPMPASFPW